MRITDSAPLSAGEVWVAPALTVLGSLADAALGTAQSFTDGGANQLSEYGNSAT